MKSAKIIHTVIGFCFVLLLGVFFAFSYAKRNPVPEGYKLSAQFGSIDGIGTGDPVILAGIPIGTITGVSYNSKDYAVTVNMIIESKYKLPVDSELSIYSQGLLGSKYLDVTLGFESEYLQANDSFDYTQDSIDFENLMAKIVKGAENRYNAQKAGEKK